MYMDLLYSWSIANVQDFFIFMMVFFGLGSIVEYINPVVKTPERMKGIKKQIIHSLPGLLVGVITVNAWRFLVEPYIDGVRWLPRNWINREYYSVFSILYDTIIFVAVYDTIFYWVHRVLHMGYFYKKFHKEHHYHHTVMTNFASSATSFGEIIINSIGLCFPLLFAPIPRRMHQLFLFGTHIYSVVSHDTYLDFMNHTAHHRYNNVNYGAYTIFWDKIMGTDFKKKVVKET